MSFSRAIGTGYDKDTPIWRLFQSPAVEKVRYVCQFVAFKSLWMNVIEKACAILELPGLVRKYGGATGRDICAEIHDIWYSTILSHVILVCSIVHVVIIIIQYVHGWILANAEEEEIERIKGEEGGTKIDGDNAEDEDTAQASSKGFFGSWISWISSHTLIVVIALDVSLSFIERPPAIVGGYEPRTWDLQRVNPYFRPLPADQDNVLREVIYMQHTLWEMYPMTTPESNYDHYSSLIENLSTRTDLSYRIWSISQIRPTIQRLHQRKITGLGNRYTTEPFFLEERIEALHRHWRQLELARDRPEPWASHSDNVFLPPLSEQRFNYTRVGKNLLETVSDDENALDLSSEQNQKADYYYKQWRGDHDHKAYFLRRDPPVPTAWRDTMGYWLHNMMSMDNPIWDGDRYTVPDKMSRFVADRGSVKSGTWKPIHDKHFDWEVRGYWPKPGDTQDSRNKAMQERKRFMDEQQAEREARKVEQDTFLRKRIHDQRTRREAKHMEL